MKTLLVAAAALLVSFTGKETESINGLWTGVYKTDSERNNMIVRLDAANELELFKEVVDDAHRMKGTYVLRGDTAIVFKYTTADGQVFTMTGKMNEKRTFVDGTWQSGTKATGSFYLKKEKIQEMFIEP